MIYLALIIIGIFCLLLGICATFWATVYFFDFPITKEELKQEIKKMIN